MGAIKQFFTPPVFPDDEDKTRTARVLYALFANMVVVLLLLTLSNIFVFLAKTIIGILLFALLILVLVSRTLAQSGRITLASQVFVSGLWILITLSLLLSGHLGNAAIAFHVAILVIASVLLGRRVAITLAVMSSLVGLGVVILEVTGHPLHRYFPNPPLTIWVTWVIAFAMTITPLNLTLRGAAQVLARARKSERRYASLFNEAPIMFLTIRNEGGKQIITDCNAAFFKNLGYRREQVIGKSLDHFYTPQSFQALLEDDSFQRALKNEIRTPIERELVAQDGHILHALVRAAPEYDESGQPIGVQAMYLDITERKRTSDIAEARLRLIQFATRHSSEELLQATLDEVEVLTGSSIGFFHFLAADQKTLILQAWSTNTLKNMCKAEGQGQHYNVDQAGVWVDCVHERRPVIHNDYLALQHRKGMPEGHAPVTRELVVPIFRDDKIVSILGVGNKPRDYDQTDIEIVSRLADLAWDIAQRKRAEEALRESEAKFRLIAEQAPAAMALSDPEQRVLFYNRKFTDLFGYSIEDVPSVDDWWPLAYPDETYRASVRECWNTAVMEAIKNRTEIAPQETLVTCRNGEKRNIEWRMTSLGQVNLVLGTDLTERKRAEEALQHSESKIRAILDQSFVFIGLMSPDGNLLHANQSALKLVGVSPLDILNKPFWESPWWNHSTELQNKLRESIRSAAAGEEVRFEASHPTIDGSLRYVDFSLRPVRNEQGDILYLIPEGHDITERKLAEENLKESQRKLATLMSNLPGLAYRCKNDPYWSMIYISAGCFELTGFYPQELEGNQVSSYGNLIHRDDEEMVWQKVQNAIDNNAFWQIEYRIHTKEGIEKWVWEQGCGVYSNAGELEVLEGFITDITERKKAEEALTKSEEKYRYIVDNAPIGILQRSIQGGFNFCNLTLAKQFECNSIDEFLLNYNDLSKRWANHEQFIEFNELLLKNGEVLGFENEVKLINGKTIWFALYFKLDSTKSIIDGFSLDITERKRAEDALSISEAKYRDIVENAPMGVFRRDMEGKFQYFNPGLIRQLECKSEKEFLDNYGLISQRWICPEKNDEFKSLLLENKRVYGFEIESRLVDGTTKWFTLYAFLDDSNQFINGFSLDITERKLAEDALSKSEWFLESIVENLPNMIFVKDAESLRFVRINKAGEDLLGCRREELIGKNDYDIFPREEAEFFVSKDRQVLSSGELVDVPEEPVMTCNKGERILHTRKIAIRDNDGRSQFLLGMSDDITERLRADELLRKLSEAVQQSPASIVITNLQGKIEFVNPKFTEITGYELNEAIGKNPRVLKSGNTPPQVYDQLWRVITSGGIWRGEFRNKKKSGEFFWELATIAPIKDKNGIPTHYVAIKEDITGQKIMEEQLRHSQKMEAVGQLAAGVAHDFNNILMGIDGYATIVKMKMQADDPLRQHMSRLLESTDRAAHLTKSLLVFSRKQVMQLMPVDLNEVISMTEKFLRRIIGEDVELRTALGRVVLITADANQLEQVIINLATNARDAMPHGGALTITTDTVDIEEDKVSFYGVEAPGSYAVISVSDTGTGMDEEMRQKIFEPFFTTKEVGRGTGLGLSIAYGIVSQHHGAINVYSQPGMGTTFRIYLPVLLLCEKHEESVNTEESIIMRGTETILLAEDDPVVREITSNLFSMFGYTMIIAEDGVDAVQKFTEHADQIRLCILDMIMPKMSGREVYDEIARLRPDVRVVFISGYTPDKIRREGLPEGCKFIQKPVPPAVLLQEVREVLDRKAGETLV